MALENVKQGILEEAHKAAKQIVAAAQKEAQQITQRQEDELEQFKQEQDKSTRHLVRVLEQNILASARFEAQQQLMSAKEDSLNQVVAEARKSLLSMDKAKRSKWLTALLKRAKTEITVAAVYVNKKDKDLLTGTTVKITEIEAGLIAETKDGSISVNLSADELLDTAKRNSLIEISEVLFSG